MGVSLFPLVSLWPWHISHNHDSSLWLSYFISFILSIFLVHYDVSFSQLKQDFRLITSWPKSKWKSSCVFGGSSVSHTARPVILLVPVICPKCLTPFFALYLWLCNIAFDSDPSHTILKTSRCRACELSSCFLS